MMQNWIIDKQGRLMNSWAEGLPGAKLLTGSAFQPQSQDIVWCRLQAGEDVETLLGALPFRGGCPIVLLADEPDDALSLKALGAGAAGCCNSRAAPEVLQQVALVVGNGGLWVGQSLLQKVVSGAAGLLARQTEREISPDWRSKLSEREREVAQMVASGASNKEIAQELRITERTVKAHLTSVFEKLGTRDRLQLSLTINGLAI